MTRSTPDSVIEDPSDPRLRTLIQSAREAGWFCIDTEFLRIDTYRPKLCLVQVATPDIAIAIDTFRPDAFSAVVELIRDAQIEKVLHSGSQDQEVLAPLTDGERLTPVFDTQIAAAFLGYGHQISYARLVEQRIGVALDKSQSRTDWSRRPLSSAQIEYALGDVTHLARLAPDMKDDLRCAGRLDWHDQEVDRSYAGSLGNDDPETLWRRISGQQAVRGPARAILREIAIWREQVARQRNRPRRWILADDEAVRVARIARRSDIDTDTIRRGRAGRWSADETAGLLEAIQRGNACPPEEIPQMPARLKPDEARSTLIDLTLDQLTARARDAGIAPELIGSRQDLNRWLNAPDSTRFHNSWVGEFGSGDLMTLRARVDAAEQDR